MLSRSIGTPRRICEPNGLMGSFRASKRRSQSIDRHCALAEQAPGLAGAVDHRRRHPVEHAAIDHGGDRAAQRGDGTVGGGGRRLPVAVGAGGGDRPDPPAQLSNHGVVGAAQAHRRSVAAQLEAIHQLRPSRHDEGERAGPERVDKCGHRLREVDDKGAGLVGVVHEHGQGMVDRTVLQREQLLGGPRERRRHGYAVDGVGGHDDRPPGQQCADGGIQRGVGDGACHQPRIGCGPVAADQEPPLQEAHASSSDARRSVGDRRDGRSDTAPGPGGGPNGGVRHLRIGSARPAAMAISSWRCRMRRQVPCRTA